MVVVLNVIRCLASVVSFFLRLTIRLLHCLDRRCKEMNCTSPRGRRYAFILALIGLFWFMLFLYGSSLHEWDDPPSYHWYQTVWDSLSSKVSNIAIVDEHHEVLQYWYAAVAKGIIAKGNNTLIHIDAHADLAPPPYNFRMPWFSAPRTPEQVASLMMRNDVFIMAAALTGLVQKVIWVYPEWVDPEISQGKDVAPTASIGYVTGESKRDSQPMICVCYVDSGGEECFVNRLDDDPLLIPRNDCVPMRQVSIVQMNSGHAEQELPDALFAKGDLILDIDEDYYGCEKGSDKLQMVPWEHVESFNNILSKVFLVNTVAEERHVHSFLTRLLRLIKDNCDIGDNGHRQCSKVQINNFVDSLEKSRFYLKELGSRPVTRAQLSQLVHYINDLFDNDILKIIVRLGFCLNTSPRTFRMEAQRHWYQRISLCHGRNNPDSTNQFMVPQIADIETIDKTFRSVLSYIPNNVRLITLSRSNRDGYTPRAHQMLIERTILTSIRERFPDTHLIYDENLMTHLQQRHPDDIF